MAGRRTTDGTDGSKKAIPDKPPFISAAAITPTRAQFARGARARERQAWVPTSHAVMTVTGAAWMMMRAYRYIRERPEVIVWLRGLVALGILRAAVTRHREALADLLRRLNPLAEAVEA